VSVPTAIVETPLPWSTVGIRVNAKVVIRAILMFTVDAKVHYVVNQSFLITFLSLNLHTFFGAPNTYLFFFLLQISTSANIRSNMFALVFA